MTYTIQFMIVTVIRDGNWEHDKVEYDYAPMSLEKQATKRVVKQNPKAKAIYAIYRGSLCVLIKGGEKGK